MATIRIVICVISCWIGTIKAAVPEVSQYPSDNIIGAGYSSDSQQITPQKCFNATVSSVSGQQAYVRLGASVSFSELESNLGTSVSVSGKYGMFAANAKADYLRSLQDTDYAISLNYYYYATNNLAVQIGGYGVQALTESGKGFFNDSKNPLFGVMCGDNYIASYQQGALLTMGLNIKLSSSKAKTEFNVKAGATYGDIASAAASVNSVAKKYGITGSIVIQAFQMGGEPSQLSNILNKDSSGNYHALTCSLTEIDNCKKAASGLLDYAKDNFAKQFSFEKNIGLTPLGVAFTKYSPIDRIGLTPPAPLVTLEVKQYRDELSRLLKENKYYQQKLYPFFNNGYPVKLQDAFINKANSLLNKAKSNVRILMAPNEGAEGCFNFPERCKSIKASIDSQLQKITVSDLKFLEDLKYYVTPVVGDLRYYNTGGGSEESWDVDPEGVSVIQVVTVKSVRWDNSQCSYLDAVDQKLFNFHIERRFTGRLKDKGGMECIGTYCGRMDTTKDEWLCEETDKSITRQLSPFFFELYSE